MSAPPVPTHPSLGAHEDVTWAAVDRGLWERHASGTFVGVVERTGPRRYRAVNGFGEQVAVCRTLDEAKAMLVSRRGR